MALTKISRTLLDTGVSDSSDATAITIDSSERVGIGESSPDELLVINGDVKIKSTNKLHFTNTSDQTSIHAPASNTIAISTNSSERMRINSSGNIGINSTNPQTKFVVQSTDGGTGIEFSMGDSESYIQCYSRSASDYKDLSIAAENLKFRTNDNSERMRIDSSGKVGIGLTNPDAYYNASLAVSLGSESSLTLASTNTTNWNYILFADGTSGDAAYRGQVAYNHQNDILALASSGYMSFSTGSGRTERMRINSSGNLLINTTSDLDSGSHLQVLGSTGGGRSPVVFQNSVDAGPSLSCWKTPTTTDSSARFIQFYANSDNTPMGGIVGNGASNVQFATLSDEREKENIIPVDNVLEKLMNLDIVSFDWKKHDEHVEAGFIAQNVEKHFPEYVIENISQEGEEARKGTTGGMSAGYIAVLTKAIQELTAEVEELKTKLESK